MVSWLREMTLASMEENICMTLDTWFSCSTGDCHIPNNDNITSLHCLINITHGKFMSQNTSNHQKAWLLNYLLYKGIGILSISKTLLITSSQRPVNMWNLNIYFKFHLAFTMLSMISDHNFLQSYHLSSK